MRMSFTVVKLNEAHYSKFFSSLNDERVLICDARYREISLNKCWFSKVCLYIKKWHWKEIQKENGTRWNTGHEVKDDNG